MIHVKVPATSANLGPGFDCIGIAFSVYNRIWVELSDRTDVKVIIKNNSPKNRIPLNEDNLIYTTMQRFYDEAGIGKLPAVMITQEDDIPLTKGLGSSAACVAAGLLAANALSGGKLNKKDICDLAARLEGHPDNSTPALVGGLVIGAMSDVALNYIKIIPKDDLLFMAMIPDFQLSTQKARSVLPKNVAIEDAVFNISHAALMAAAFSCGDNSMLAAAMEDRLHQPHRAPLIPGMDGIIKAAKDNGALGAYLSGAGPSIIAVCDGGAANGFYEKMDGYLRQLHNVWTLVPLTPDIRGAEVTVTDPVMQ